MQPNGPDRPWKLRFGASVVEGGEVEFRVWAPKLSTLALRILDGNQRTIPMAQSRDSEFSCTISDVVEGTDYVFVLEGDRVRPDPVSRWQPHGVHGPSRIVDPRSFPWSDAGWNGLPLKDLVIYELHTGTFTSEGTFESVVERLPYLRELGITALELMPVAQFPGARNWGYDGASLYAPQATYGGPQGLKKLVDACHGLGLAVVLDVVYNHLGPEGSYLPDFAPCFTQAYRTPWGPAINFDGADSDGVRRFFIDNALYWLTEYHVDAIRLDAVHGIYDFSAHHILDELTEAFHREAQRQGRLAWVIAESDLDDVRIINPRSAGGYGVDAQWHDDFHHALYTLLTGDKEGYLMDFGSFDDLAKSIREGFVYDGRYSRYRRRHHGSSSRERPGERFVACIQNHDQVANTSKGRRLSSVVSREQEKLAAALLLCSPFLPLLFMGQEYGEIMPFFFFTSYGDSDLVAAVRRGRKEEVAAYYAEADFPDPQAETTFERCKLDWSRAELLPHVGILGLYRDLLSLRRRHACLHNCDKSMTSVTFNQAAKWLVMTRGDPSGSEAILICNFSAHATPVAIPCGGHRWKMALWTGDPAYKKGLSSSPPQELAANAGEDPLVTLAEFSAVLYLGSQQGGVDSASGSNG
jgi:maltooligosyltrehalose trehalohydrolase